MKIQSINLIGINGIKELSINFQEHANIICGPNGIGKTTILEAIAESFNGTSNRSNTNLTKNVTHKEGIFEVHYEFFNNFKKKNYRLKRFKPIDKTEYIQVDFNESKKFIYFKANRTFDYSNLDSIQKDQVYNEIDIRNIATAGVKYNTFKNWFVNRFLFSAQPGALSDNQKMNLDLAKDVFSYLDPNVKFKTVETESLDIIVQTPTGDIYFEYLSSGFKSCLYILHGLMKEIEFRFKKPADIYIKSFDGIVLIDEIDLHLHPEWQAKLYIMLKNILPNAQLIVTTHSPHIIQVAHSNELIPLEIVDNNIQVKDLPSLKFGFQGWTIEEILEDVMGLKTTYSEVYLKAAKDFELGISNGDNELTKSAFNKLNQMLHPNNSLRKILRIQIAQLGIVLEEDV